MNLEQLVQLPRGELVSSLAELSERELLIIRWRLLWLSQSREKQRPPRSFTHGNKFIWFIRSGRGFGKTMCAANWLALEAVDDPESMNFVVAPTSADLVGTCFEGETGLLRYIPDELVVRYVTAGPMAPFVELDNGAMIRGFSAHEPDRLRGPQCKRAWCDEVGVWRYGKEVWDNLMFGLRLGPRPVVMCTGTPKPRPLVKLLSKHEHCVMVLGTTYENKDNLPDSFFQEIVKYEGTTIGRQEIHGELIDPEELGVIKRSWWRLWSAEKKLPEFTYLVLSLDTAFTEKTFDKDTYDPDFTAAGVWGVFYEKTLEASSGRVVRRQGLPAVMLLDAWQERLGMPALITKIKATLKQRYGAPTVPLIHPVFGASKLTVDGKTFDLLIIEDKGSGISARQLLELDGIIAHAYNPGRVDKLSRLHEVSSLFARGRVWTVESKKTPKTVRAWAEECISQVCQYAGEGSIDHDDHVDQTTQVLRVLMHHGLLKVVDEGMALKELAREAESKITGVPPKPEVWPRPHESRELPPEPQENPYG